MVTLLLLLLSALLMLHCFVKFTDADTYSHPYQLDTNRVLVERNENQEPDGVAGASDETERLDDLENQKRNIDCERYMNVEVSISCCMILVVIPTTSTLTVVP